LKKLKEKSQTYLKNDLNYNDLIYEKKPIYSGENAKVFKANKTTSQLYVIKMTNLRLNDNGDQINTEIQFYEKFHLLMQSNEFFPEYHGYMKFISILELISYHLILTYYPTTLRDLILKKKISDNFKLIKQYFYNLINILAFLQTYGIAHRDIKPENIIIDDASNRVFLIDFGISIKIRENNDFNGKYSGTMGYCAPEWRKLYYDQKEIIGNFDLIKADSFSLGLVALEMGGIKLNMNLDRYKTYQAFEMSLRKKIQSFYSKFEKEINENLENKRFYDDLIAILILNPDERSDFIKIFINSFNLNNKKKKKKIS